MWWSHMEVSNENPTSTRKYPQGSASDMFPIWLCDLFWRIGASDIRTNTAHIYTIDAPKRLQFWGSNGRDIEW